VSDPQKLAKAFDLMIWGLTDAGYSKETIHKFVVRARQDLGVPQEESAKTKVKLDFAEIVSEAESDSAVDGSSEAPEPGKSRRARAGAEPN
jgi:hypothetical protein